MIYFKAFFNEFRFYEIQLKIFRYIKTSQSYRSFLCSWHWKIAKWKWKNINFVYFSFLYSQPCNLNVKYLVTILRHRCMYTPTNLMSFIVFKNKLLRTVHFIKKKKKYSFSFDLLTIYLFINLWTSKLFFSSYILE